MNFVKCKGDVYINLDRVDLIKILKHVDGTYSVAATYGSNTVVVADYFPDKQYAIQHVIGLIS